MANELRLTTSPDAPWNKRLWAGQPCIFIIRQFFGIMNHPPRSAVDSGTRLITGS
jgi:hypothetical protein